MKKNQITHIRAPELFFMSESQPKTKEELLQEKLRDINANLTIFKSLMGTSSEFHETQLELHEKRRKDARGVPRFVKVNGTHLVEGTDRLEAMLKIEESLEILLQMQGKDPVKHTEKLLAQKIRILKELLPYSKQEKSNPNGQ